MSLEITFRTLKGGIFKISAKVDEKVIDIKKKVGEQQKIEQYTGIRLIFKGKILNDDATVGSAGITATGFVVVMPPKKSIAKPTAATPAPPVAPEPAPVAAPAAAAIPAAPTTTTPEDSTMDTENSGNTTVTETAEQPAVSISADDPNSLVTGAAYEQSVQQIVEMGFPEADVKRALRAAFNNPQRAVDYLFNGIPESAAAAVAPPTMPISRSQQPGDGTSATRQIPGGAARGANMPAPGTPFNMFEAPTQTAAGAGAAGAGGNLDFLRQLPQFNIMRRLIQSNPSVLPQILQQLEETNPSLLAVIEANQAEFTRLINEPVREGEEGADDDVMEQLAQAMAGAGGPGGQPGPGQVYVTEEEHEQIVRLFELGATIGLEESHVVETWLACNRDETAAANYLVDHAEELRADAQQNNANPPNPPDTPDSGNDGPPA